MNQFSKAPFTQYNLLSNRLSNRFDHRLYRVYKHSTRLNEQWLFVHHGCQTGCTMRFDNWLKEQLFVQHGCQTGLYNRFDNGVERTAVRSTRLTTGWMFVYTIQPVVKPVVKPVWQLVVSCKRGLRSNAEHLNADTNVCACVRDCVLPAVGPLLPVCDDANVFVKSCVWPPTIHSVILVMDFLVAAW